jgi:O-antigen ligase
MNRLRHRDVFLFAIFSILLLVAEHASPLHPVATEDWDSSYLIAIQEGSVHRRAAYLILATLGLILLLRRTCPNLRFDSRFLWSGMALLTWDVVSFTWSDQPLIALKRLFVLFCVFLWASGCVATWSGRIVTLFILTSTTLNLVLSIGSELLSGQFAPFDPAFRLGGTLAPNLEGINCLILLLAACTVAHGRRPSWPYWTLAAFGLGGLVLTRSRTALIALPIATAVYYLFVAPRFTRKVALSAMAIVLGGGIILGQMGLQISPLNILPRSSEGKDSLNGRLPLWQDLWSHYITKSPILGYGYASFWTNRHIDALSDEQGWGIAAAHSGYLEVMLDGGVVGETLYVLLLITILGCAIRNYRATGAADYAFAGALLAVFLIDGITESLVITRISPIFAYSTISFVMIGIRHPAPLHVMNWRRLHTKPVPAHG